MKIRKILYKLETLNKNSCIYYFYLNIKNSKYVEKQRNREAENKNEKIIRIK